MTDKTYHPENWSEYVGQERLKRRMKLAIAAAKAEGEPLGHILIKGPSGMGKTSLARIIAIAVGGGLQVEADPIPQENVPYIFDSLQDGDVLFLDEVHRQFAGRGSKGEWLLYLLEQGMMSDGHGNLDAAPKVTVVAATTDHGRIPKTILDRFELVLTLEPYSCDEAAQIVQALSVKILTPRGLTIPNDETAAAIARAASGQPRIIRRLLLGLCTLVFGDAIEDNGDGSYDLEAAFEWADLTPDGLTPEMQEYLRLLYKHRGQPIGAKALSDRLGEVGDGLRMIEGSLEDKDLIAKTGRGRTLTTEGRKRAKQLVDAA